MKEGRAQSDYLSMNIPDLVFFWSHILAPQLQGLNILKRIETEF